MVSRVGALVAVTVMVLGLTACGSVDEAAIEELLEEIESGGVYVMPLPDEWPSEIPIPEARLAGWSDTSNSVQKRVETNWGVPGSSEPEFAAFIEAYFDELRAAGFIDTDGIARSELTGGDYALDGEFVGAERTLSVTASITGEMAMLYVRIPDVVFTMP